MNDEFYDIENIKSLINSSKLSNSQHKLIWKSILKIATDGVVRV